MNRCYLGLGSNLKTPARQVRLSLNKLRCLPKSALIKTTPLTITKPWGVHSQLITTHPPTTSRGLSAGSIAAACFLDPADKPRGVGVSIQFSQPNYCNAIVQLNTTLPPHLLLKKIHHIEKQQGRVRKRKWGARTLDIDILYYGNLILKHPKLTIPHPYIMQREFILKPLQALWQDTAQTLK